VFGVRAPSWIKINLIGRLDLLDNLDMGGFENLTLRLLHDRDIQVRDCL
jgi:hypothetical protein